MYGFGASLSQLLLLWGWRCRNSGAPRICQWRFGWRHADIWSDVWQQGWRCWWEGQRASERGLRAAAAAVICLVIHACHGTWRSWSDQRRIWSHNSIRHWSCGKNAFDTDTHLHSVHTHYTLGHSVVWPATRARARASGSWYSYFPGGRVGAGHVPSAHAQVCVVSWWTDGPASV